MKFKLDRACDYGYSQIEDILSAYPSLKYANLIVADDDFVYIEIKTLDELKELSETTKQSLNIDFKYKTITIFDEYL